MRISRASRIWWPIADYRRMFRALFAGRRTVGLAWSGGFPRTGQVERTAGLIGVPAVAARGAGYASS